MCLLAHDARGRDVRRRGNDRNQCAGHNFSAGARRKISTCVVLLPLFFALVLARDGLRGRGHRRGRQARVRDHFFVRSSAFEAAARELERALISRRANEIRDSP